VKSKSNKAFSLLEVLITSAILTSAIVFVFRSFSACIWGLSSSRNVNYACLLAEGKLWEMEQRQSASVNAIPKDSGIEEVSGKTFQWDYETAGLTQSNLVEADLTISWEERPRKESASLKFTTYLISKLNP